MKFSLRLLYLYLFSFIGLLVVVIGSIRLLTLGIKTFVFPDADNFETVPYASPDGKFAPATESAQFQEFNQKQIIRNRQRELAEIISMIIVGLPLYLYHWHTIQKENTENKA